MSGFLSNHVLMIRPVSFGFNPQTAASNTFMHQQGNKAQAQIEALKCFDDFVTKLREAGIGVSVISDTLVPHTPDSIFPNNWVSFHSDGRVVLYPMEAPNRRLERRMDIINEVRKDLSPKQLIDFSYFEELEAFLEGTGSLVLDREHKLAYVGLSSRSHLLVLSAWKAQFSAYEIISFHASDLNDIPIYHTNVMLCVALDFVVICAEAIKDKLERREVLASFEACGKAVLSISISQMSEFAGNMLQLKNKQEEPVLVLSKRAYDCLNDKQVSFLSSRTRILYSELGAIETLGGGSARCMIAEVF